MVRHYRVFEVSGRNTDAKTSAGLDDEVKQAFEHVEKLSRTIACTLSLKAATIHILGWPQYSSQLVAASQTSATTTAASLIMARSNCASCSIKMPPMARPHATEVYSCVRHERMQRRISLRGELPTADTAMGRCVAQHFLQLALWTSDCLACTPRGRVNRMVSGFTLADCS